jgi:hypothetical protein
VKRGIGWMVAIVIAIVVAIAVGRGGREPPPAPVPPERAGAPADSAAAADAGRGAIAGGATGAVEVIPGGAVLRPTDVPPGSHPEIGFRSPQHLLDHWTRHGREFDATTPSDYLALAQALRDAPTGGSVLERVRADGVVTRFDRATGTFIAFDPDLTLRTCFRPADGEAYFRRQAMREAR